MTLHSSSPQRWAWLLAILYLLPASARAADDARRPNIIIMMADDMGFSDIGCYGGEIRTPNLDALAAHGLRFTSFYNTGRCCPTRAALLTGLYPHQAGVGHMMEDRGTDGYRGNLNRECVTIAEALRPAGYSTYMAGKWHVTRFLKPDQSQNWPRQRGFDRYFGTITGAGSFFRPNTLVDGNTPVTEFPKDFYYTDAIADHAVQYISEHQGADKPFFMYVAFTSPHWPLHALKEDIDRYRGKYLVGFEALRKQRHARMIEKGIVAADWPITPQDSQALAWDKLDDKRKQELDLRMAIYAAQIDRMDQGIGRIVAALKKKGELDNTLILFLADNGGCAEGGPGGFDRLKGELGTDASFSSYGLSWANTSNTPFRMYKHWVHEGGISSPLIAHWPARIKDAGKLRRQPAHLIDLMATSIDVSGAKYPAELNGKKIQPMEGKSLAPAFADKPIEREAIYWEHEGNRAVRMGKWKLVAKGRKGPWELYDMDADRTELNDLSAKDPERVKQMSAQWDAWAKRARVIPWPK